MWSDIAGATIEAAGPPFTPSAFCRTFFSLHYARDLARAATLRDSPLIEPVAAAGWEDATIWEAAKARGEEAVHALIDAALEGTAATVFCLGAETAQRTYVDYEIRRSAERGNVLLGVRIHALADAAGRADPPGEIPFRLKTLGAPVFQFISADLLATRIRQAVDAPERARA